MSRPTVFLADDDRDVRESIVWMLEHEGILVEAFATPGALLQSYDPGKHGCLVLDLCLPEVNGLELRRQLVEMGCEHPFIIITGHGEVPDVASAMRMGAVDFIEKPLHRKVFIERIWQAIENDVKRRHDLAGVESIQKRLDSLTPREQEVLELVVAGMLTKQIARRLEVSVKTIEAHRASITRKMQVDSVAQLVRIVTEHASFKSATE